jgi:hypothetical protein
MELIVSIIYVVYELIHKRQVAAAARKARESSSPTMKSSAAPATMAAAIAFAVIMATEAMSDFRAALYFITVLVY